jgi:ribosomal protein L7Ae-like RNA K-turn-binding protein
MGIRKLCLNKNLAGYLGIALKSKNIVLGYEAVTRYLKRTKIAVIIISSEISHNSLKKINYMAQKENVPLFKIIYEKELLDSVQGIAGYKVVGLLRGNLAMGFLNKIKQEY